MCCVLKAHGNVSPGMPSPGSRSARSPAAVADCLAELGRHVQGELRTDAYTRILYSTDASIYQVEPLGVLIPRSMADVHAAVETAAKHGVPILPRTSGSSLAGQAVNEALVIDFTRHLDQILEVRPEERWVRVEPGIVLDELNRQLRPLGLQFGPDPASSERAALGGVVSNNSTGAHSILHGMTADHVQAMNVILADGSRAHFGPISGPDSAAELAARGARPGREGEIYRAIAALVTDPENQAIIRAGTPRHWRRCGGYNLDRLIPSDGLSFRLPPDPRFNLAKLVCGAEGGLAVMEDITLGLVRVPARTALAVVHFRSLREALEAVPVLLETDPSAVELLDHLGLTLCREVPEYSRLLSTFVEGNPNCLLITEFHGDSEAELRGRIDGLRQHLTHRGVTSTAVVPMLAPEGQARVWKVRKAGLGLLMSIKGDFKPIPFIEDAAVPVEHLADYIQQIEAFCADLGTRVAYYAHASAGCLHVRPLINAKDAREVAKLPRILSFSVELLRGNGSRPGNGGSLSSEHGDGRTRGWIGERFFGPELYRLYRQVKAAFDPANLLNPGMVVGSPAMTENLRFGPEYRTLSAKSHLDFSADQGFERAVEMCNGAGVCRKLSGGTLCPSFMVTREEEHSTRGRANALRAALSGHLPPTELTSSRMHEVFDLCIECKACKAECPSSVDMAKIKFEFLARYHEARGGAPLRSRLFAAVPALARLLAGPLAPLANAALGSGAGRYLGEKLLGLSRHRPLPPFARQPFPTWFARSAPRVPASRELRGEVVLFADTFTSYQEPAVARAAVEVLAAAGFEVLLSDHGCCGRPAISKGLVDEARAAARQTVTRLAPHAAAGRPIIGLEPGCILSLRDEYLSLLPGDETAARVAASAVTFEEFIARLADAGQLDLPLGEDGPRCFLLHGHCHQKALVGTAPSHRLLGLIPGAEITEVDSGCCGMAGSFGYEAEHYEISQAMAERRLLPAVREMGEGTVAVAAGTSCRAQIAHGTGRKALHPAEVLAAALAR